MLLQWHHILDQNKCSYFLSVDMINFPVILAALSMEYNSCTDPISKMVEMHYKASVKLDWFSNRNSNANIINMYLNFMIFEHAKDHQSFFDCWGEKKNSLRYNSTNTLTVWCVPLSNRSHVSSGKADRAKRVSRPWINTGESDHPGVLSSQGKQ